MRIGTIPAIGRTSPAGVDIGGQRAKGDAEAPPLIVVGQENEPKNQT
jgi:hypothetical protein